MFVLEIAGGVVLGLLALRFWPLVVEIVMIFLILGCVFGSLIIAAVLIQQRGTDAFSYVAGLAFVAGFVTRQAVRCLRWINDPF